MKRLGGIFTGSAAGTDWKIVTDPFVGFAFSHHHTLRLMVDEPVKLFASVAAKLTTEGKAAGPSEPTPADEATRWLLNFLWHYIDRIAKW